MPRILLHDASILIDLLSVDLLGVSLNLPFEMETTDFIIFEFTDAHQTEEVGRQVADGKLVVVHSNDEDVAALSMFKTRHSNLSLADCSVLFRIEVPQETEGHRAGELCEPVVRGES